MASLDLKVKLLHHVASMFEQGMLDEQFHDVEKLKTQNIGFITRYISTFFYSVEKKLAGVDKIVIAETVDFAKLLNVVCQIRSSSNMIGAQNLKHAIIPLLQFSKANDKGGFVLALHGFKREYQHMRSQLEIILKMEQIIHIMEQD